MNGLFLSNYEKVTTQSLKIIKLSIYLKWARRHSRGNTWEDGEKEQSENDDDNISGEYLLFMSLRVSLLS